MKRHAFALIIHPCKNSLMQQSALVSRLNDFVERLLALTTAYPMLRFNLCMPGFMLPLIDPLQLARLREIHKGDRIEWLTPGFTEPFISFSPHWLTGKNIAEGLQMFHDHLGHRPCGYIPPFSNWEPSIIDTLRDNAIQYAVVSRALFAERGKNHCGYWITEHAGSITILYPAFTVTAHDAPVNLGDWIGRTLMADPLSESAVRLVTIDYRIDLCAMQEAFDWLAGVAAAMDSLLVKYQVIRAGEFISMAYPDGLQFLQPSLLAHRSGDDSVGTFLNDLHSFDQVSLLQRKMLDVADAVRPIIPPRLRAPLLRSLFFAQDINRYLPAREAGFMVPADRCSTYARLIDIETELLAIERQRGCQLRICDYLRNGTKCIILSNRALKVYIDHKNGGQIFELDVRDRSLNCCAGFNPKPYPMPRVLLAGFAHTAFADHIFDPQLTFEHYHVGSPHQRGDFLTGPFNYKVKNTERGVKAILNRQGSINLDERTYPLYMEKVFGLDEQNAALSFAYQLSNPSLAPVTFTLGISITLLLPGIQTGQVHISANRKAYRDIASHPIDIESAVQWSIIDLEGAVALQFKLPKPMRLWCTSTGANETDGTLTIMLSAPVSLQDNAVWSCMGRIAFKKLRSRKEPADAI